MAISHCYWHVVCNCCHFATDHLHDYIHFTIYHLQLHFWCSEAQAISAISPKTCTLKLQLLHNTKRWTNWSGHVKMIDPPRELLHMKDRWCPPPIWNCQWKWVNSVFIHTVNENPFITVNWQENDRWCPPPIWNCQWKWVNSVCIHTVNENPFVTVNWQENDRWCPPPIWNYQSTEWSLHCSVWSMRAHLKQSTYKKI